MTGKKKRNKVMSVFAFFFFPPLHICCSSMLHSMTCTRQMCHMAYRYDIKESIGYSVGKSCINSIPDLCFLLSTCMQVSNQKRYRIRKIKLLFALCRLCFPKNQLCTIEYKQIRDVKKKWGRRSSITKPNQTKSLQVMPQLSWKRS